MLKGVFFLVRHTGAVLFLSAGAGVATVAIFLLLYLLAIIFDLGLGGPLAPFFWTGLVAGAALAIGGTIFAPSCAAGALASWLFRWPAWVSLLVALLISPPPSLCLALALH